MMNVNIRKLLIITAAMAIFSSSTAIADSRIGVRGGVAMNKIHISTTNIEETITEQQREGFTIGLVAEQQLALGFAVDASVNYMTRSSIISINSITDVDTRHYITIPIYLKWKLGFPLIGEIVKPMVIAGPEVDLRTSELKSNFTSTLLNASVNIGAGVELLKSFEVSFVYGTGLSTNTIYNYSSNPTISIPQPIKGSDRFWTLTATCYF